MPKRYSEIFERPDTERVAGLRRRVRDAMEQPPETWTCPARIDDRFMNEPLPVRKARAITLKLRRMPTDLWDGQLFAGSMTMERPRLHAERGFPDYATDEEREEAAQKVAAARSNVISTKSSPTVGSVDAKNKGLRAALSENFDAATGRV